MLKLRGIHHITAIATDPQRNVDFYTQLLGLRLVVTFFPWPRARRGSRGTGQVVATSFAIRPEAIDFWKKRLSDEHVVAEEAPRRFGRRVLRLTDPDGLMLELIESDHFDAIELNKTGDVPDEFALRGFNAPTLEVQLGKLTEQLLIGTFGFDMINEEKGRRRFSLNPDSPAAQIDLVERTDTGFGNISAGTVHHIAFRAADEQEQLQWRALLEEIGLGVTPVIDRQYFHSIYFREPGGILFEIATDKPGFATDEPVEHLGEALKLPPQYEEHRGSIEQVLPPIALPVTFGS
jgi:glyoxalase family protein